MNGFDRHLERWVVHHRAEWLDPVFVWISRIGEAGAIWLAIGFALAILWRRPAPFLLVVAADALAQLVSALLRAAIHEQRPPLRYHEPAPLVGVPASHSFPSGHTASSFACATVLTALSPRLGFPLYVLALAIGFSRIYDGVHYPFDILGGVGVGVGIGLGIVLLTFPARRWRREAGGHSA